MTLQSWLSDVVSSHDATELALWRLGVRRPHHRPRLPPQIDVRLLPLKVHLALLVRMRSPHRRLSAPGLALCVPIQADVIVLKV